MYILSFVTMAPVKGCNKQPSEQSVIEVDVLETYTHILRSFRLHSALKNLHVFRTENLRN